ncbi:CapA family protein [Eubacterium oxidoreducens]|uniref:Poly-gamma-glutamate synthesis protein (Capsule biosynthesis protein) n=1 Tax=Eubacterium oxidoreducens TaxID=1732 RepID=A0A1G6CJ05_EUBOX|nr:CapA family protein [Eubacterium oxidoreducens]SDB32888.1 poly-gamma-glutamate synthesis protein (capsule biosynthesis protein) [Eubacterium oxidoreducens]
MKKYVSIPVMLCLVGTMLAGCGSTNTEKTENTNEAESSAQLSVAEPVTEGDGSESTAPVEEPKVQTITISATGDCTLGRAQIHGYSGSFDDYYDRYGETYFFSGVKDIFEADDFTVVNLECVLTTSETGEEKEFMLKGDPSYTGIMTSSSVEGCSFGNNHNMDYGQQSFDDTINALNEAGLSYAVNDQIGTYETDEGLKIGFVSSSLLSGTQDRVDYLVNGINQLKEDDADLIIACCHWGVEQEHYANDNQVELAHQLIEEGADVIIGNHPHVLQGIEYYKGKLICYSLGNFSFGGNSNPTDKQDGIFTQTFTYVDGKLDEEAQIDATFIPCTLSGAANYNDFCPQIASGDTKAAILENMAKYSAGYSDLSFDEDGKILTQSE